MLRLSSCIRSRRSSHNAGWLQRSGADPYLAQTGAFLEYDGRGRIKYFAEGEILDLILKMFDLGLGPSFAGVSVRRMALLEDGTPLELAMVASRGDDQIAVRGRKRSNYMLRDRKRGLACFGYRTLVKYVRRRSSCVRMVSRTASQIAGYSGCM